MSYSVLRLRTFHRCPKLYQYSYIDKMEPVRKAEALNFGSLFHAGLNAWWSPKHENADQRLAAALAALRDHWQQNFRVLDAYAGVTAEELMIAYHERWKDAESVRPYAVEAAYEGDIIDIGRKRSGRIDLMAMVGVDRFLEVFRYAVVEHKTTDADISPGSQYWTKLRVDTQVSEYLLGASSIVGGQPVEYVLYDVTLKPDIKPEHATPPDKRKWTQGKPCKKHANETACVNCDGSGWKEKPRLHANQRDRDEHPEEWRQRLREWIAKQPLMFARQIVPRLEHELEEADRETAQTVRMIDLCKENNVWPKNDGACMAFGRPCDFRDVCNGVARLDDPTRFQVKTFTNAPKEDRKDVDFSSAGAFAPVPDPESDEPFVAVEDPADE